MTTTTSPLVLACLAALMRARRPQLARELVECILCKRAFRRWCADAYNYDACFVDKRVHGFVRFRIPVVGGVVIEERRYECSVYVNGSLQGWNDGVPILKSVYDWCGNNDNTLTDRPTEMLAGLAALMRVRRRRALARELVESILRYRACHTPNNSIAHGYSAEVIDGKYHGTERYNNNSMGFGSEVQWVYGKCVEDSARFWNADGLPRTIRGKQQPLYT